MEAMRIEVRDFMSAHHPFDFLPNDVLSALTEKVVVTAVDQGTVVVQPGKRIDFYTIIRSGAVESRDPEGQLIGRHGEGNCFGERGLLDKGGVAVNTVTTIEDCVFYRVPANEFHMLHRSNKDFANFVNPEGSDRLRSVHARRAEEDEGLNLMSTQLRSMVNREPVTIPVDATVRQAAEVMSENRVSCILVTQNEKLAGIFTDRDLRSRVVAKGLAIDTPIREVMTADPVSMPDEKAAFDALLIMLRKNIHHLPVTRDGKVSGVVTDTTFLRKQTKSAIYLVGDIYKKNTFEGLAEDVAHIPDVLATLVEAGGTSHNIGHIITSITDATTIRLMQMAEEKLGPPPVSYVWCAAGSQARQEQTGVSDQDNCLILSDDYDQAKHGDYFTAFAKFVCDGLNACGYVYCPGEMMAMTDEWRQPLRVWKKYFTKWIDEPEPKALMLSCVFFDLRPIRGDMALYEQIQKLIIAKSQASGIFIAHMIGNALTHNPPLGFFKNFVLIKGGEHDHSFDMKHSGVVPIVDIARIYSLHTGCESVNTHERLISGKESRFLSPSGARDLQDAYEFIAITRLKHQARQIKAGQKPNNYLEPDDLSPFERSHLKDAFSVVKTIQSAMENKH